ncbi:acyl-CoA N-acyltransferase [Pseudovirgaria hyperparasitica]|uniref:Histone acetyltransferase type B catalytic subunit n=1 Tax=Pseudovirgaria hyperparasitica TaxID=470096 RepID=A0A6A6WN56_9PEZI|nr:acyl-CoA N-acyltransferase [Pseudovirgaria hyperparasitica]KAF2763479.1 acyl-CoA N-acyltransferase [Pseudovirgaria hyperparasitica]
MEEIQKYIVSSNDAFDLNMYRPGDHSYVVPEKFPVFKKPFHPRHTYPIFGEDEAILGYSKLQLDLRFRTTDMKPRFAIKYKEKWKPIGETQPMDVKKMMLDYCPDFDFSENYPEDIHGPEWRPPGKLVRRWKHATSTYEVWQTTLTDPRALEIFRNFQILIPFFIEGGVIQTTTEDEWTLRRWKLFLAYDVTPFKESDDELTNISPYIFAGFATSYRLWVMPCLEVMKTIGALPTQPESTNGNAADLEKSWKPPAAVINSDGTPNVDSGFDDHKQPSRERISQFVILPPYQHQSIGSHIYQAMVRDFLRDENVFEITVEDPNERFDDMRDWNDLVRLSSDPVWQSLSLPETIPSDRLKRKDLIPTSILVDQTKAAHLRRKFKISSRQFSRLTEMHLLNTIPVRHRTPLRIAKKENAPDENDRKYYFWRMLVKERIFYRNCDVLMQLPTREEQREKVTQSLNLVQEEYNRILGKLPDWIEYAKLAEDGGVDEAYANRAEVRTNRALKRVRIVDDEDEMDEDQAPKKSKIYEDEDDD